MSRMIVDPWLLSPVVNATKTIKHSVEMRSLSLSAPARPRKLKIHGHVRDALPERWVTVHSGDMGYTPGLLRGEQKCPGRSVTRWMNGSSSSPGCWMGRRWRCCAVSSASRARPATRSSRATTKCLEGLTDRSRRPYRHANQLPFQIETQIVRLKQDRPSWGAPKIREKLRLAQHGGATRPE